MDKSSGKAGFGSHIEKTRAPRAHKPHVGTDFHFDDMVTVLSISNTFQTMGRQMSRSIALQRGLYTWSPIV